MRMRMARTVYPSLLDDPAFVDQLDQIEATGPPLVEFKIAKAPSEKSGSRCWLHGRSGVIADATTAVLAFVGLMAVGFAAAASVFADRVRLILAR
jgi:hypothetical protein